MTAGVDSKCLERGKNLKADAKVEEPWKVLATFCPPASDPDTQRWWENVAPVIGRALKITGYTTESQYRYLLLMQAVLVPFLGPYPNENCSNVVWPCCIAGKRGPTNISINYQRSKTTFRITVEPIGANAGMEADPMNKVAPRQLLQRLKDTLPGVDLTWYNQLEGAMTISNQDAPRYWDAISQFPIKTQMLIATDLHEGSVNVKAAFFPHIRAAATGEDLGSLLFDTTRKLCTTKAFQNGISSVEQYFRSIQNKLVPEKQQVCFDCVAPALSRVKIYMAVNMTSLTDVYDFWTLGGKAQGPAIEKGFQLIKRAWDVIYPKQLPNGTYRDAMTVHCNWQISPSDPNPVPKAYFLLYQDYDRHITSAVVDLFRNLGWDEHIKTHQALEDEAYSIADIGSNSDIYNWLSFSYSEKSGPYITVYSKPLSV